MANQNKLTVIISGGPATGKTTLALAFQEFLRSRDIKNVDVIDVDLPRDHGTPCEYQDMRLDAIARKNTKVEIITNMAEKD